MIRRPLISTLFPYTTLFRSVFINQERKSEVRRRSDTVVVPTINDADRRCGGVIPMTRRAASGKPKSLGSGGRDRKSTRLNSSHTVISYAVFCLKKKKTIQTNAVLSVVNELVHFAKRAV